MLDEAEKRGKVERILFDMFNIMVVKDSIDLSGESGFDLTFELMAIPLGDIFQANVRGLENRGIRVRDRRFSKDKNAHVLSCDLDLDRLG
ncbi:MAG: hypothetical protein MPL62_04225 [Alphaproteobacteria bacterium]|nr:hypothetical protein [Alphaproteobacteria bacterium]